MYNLWFVLLAGGLCLAFCAFVEVKTKKAKKRKLNIEPCFDPCLHRCTNYTRTEDASLEVVCHGLNCKCFPDGIPREVTRLVFTGNKMSSFNTLALQKLTELYELDLNSNRIR